MQILLNLKVITILQLPREQNTSIKFLILYTHLIHLKRSQLNFYPFRIYPSICNYARIAASHLSIFQFCSPNPSHSHLNRQITRDFKAPSDPGRIHQAQMLRASEILTKLRHFSFQRLRESLRTDYHPLIISINLLFTRYPSHLLLFLAFLRWRAGEGEMRY